MRVCPEELMGAEGSGMIKLSKFHFTILAVSSYSLFLFAEYFPKVKLTYFFHLHLFKIES